jgi:endonuclease III-like uncharacterized protein
MKGVGKMTIKERIKEILKNENLDNICFYILERETNIFSGFWKDVLKDFELEHILSEDELESELAKEVSVDYESYAAFHLYY